MAMYVIVDIKTGRYVAQSGGRRSYTPKLQYARTWGSRDAAEGERCPDSERVVSVEQAIGGAR